jgi:uncharacterized membrane protein YkvA (DUF1232 family)
MKTKIEELKKLGKDPKVEAQVRQKFWSYFKKNKSNIRFVERIEVLYEMLSNKMLQKQDRWVLIGALIYFINPIDVVPDVTPFLGFLDDAGVIAMAYRYFSNRAVEVRTNISEQTEQPDIGEVE